jgi:hypothetical protein
MPTLKKRHGKRSIVLGCQPCCGSERYQRGDSDRNVESMEGDTHCWEDGRAWTLLHDSTRQTLHEVSWYVAESISVFSTQLFPSQAISNSCRVSTVRLTSCLLGLVLASQAHCMGSGAVRRLLPKMHWMLVTGAHVCRCRVLPVLGR